jgi:hypothetical protein
LKWSSSSYHTLPYVRISIINSIFMRNNFHERRKMIWISFLWSGSGKKRNFRIQIAIKINHSVKIFSYFPLPLFISSFFYFFLMEYRSYFSCVKFLSPSLECLFFPSTLYVILFIFSMLKHENCSTHFLYTSCVENESGVWKHGRWQTKRWKRKKSFTFNACFCIKMRTRGKLLIYGVSWKEFLIIFPSFCVRLMLSSTVVIIPCVCVWTWWESFNHGRIEKGIRKGFSCTQWHKYVSEVFLLKKYFQKHFSRVCEGLLWELLWKTLWNCQSFEWLIFEDALKLATKLTAFFSEIYFAERYGKFSSGFISFLLASVFFSKCSWWWRCCLLWDENIKQKLWNSLLSVVFHRHEITMHCVCSN